MHRSGRTPRIFWTALAFALASACASAGPVDDFLKKYTEVTTQNVMRLNLDDPSYRINVWETEATQPGIGGIEVDYKARRFKKQYRKSKSKFIAAIEDKIARIVACGDGIYLIDGNHSDVALARSGLMPFMRVEIKDRVSGLSRAECAEWLERNGYTQLYSISEGRTLRFDELPRNVVNLPDEPYRSLAWTVRKTGGYEKVETDYAEFEWGKFLRTKIPPERLAADFRAATLEALAYAHSDEAKNLPGFTTKSLENDPEAILDDLLPCPELAKKKR